MSIQSDIQKKEREIQATKEAMQKLEEELNEMKASVEAINFDGTKEGWLRLFEFLEEEAFESNGKSIHKYDFISIANNSGEIIYNTWKIKVKDSHTYGSFQEDLYIIFELYDISDYLCSKEDFHSYWRIDGFYQSYVGEEWYWDDIKQVKPVEKTVIEWE